MGKYRVGVVVWVEIKVLIMSESLDENLLLACGASMGIIRALVGRRKFHAPSLHIFFQTLPCSRLWKIIFTLSANPIFRSLSRSTLHRSALGSEFEKLRKQINRSMNAKWRRGGCGWIQHWEKHRLVALASHVRISCEIFERNFYFLIRNQNFNFSFWKHSVRTTFIMRWGQEAQMMNVEPHHIALS